MIQYSFSFTLMYEEIQKYNFQKKICVITSRIEGCAYDSSCQLPSMFQFPEPTGKSHTWPTSTFHWRLIPLLTVGQRRWRTAVSHLLTWRPQKQANKAKPDLVFYDRHTLTQAYTHKLIWVVRTGYKKSRSTKPSFCHRDTLYFRRELEDSTLWGGGFGHVWVSEVEDSNFSHTPR